MNIVVAITGASGAIYARQSLDILLNTPCVERIALILSHHAEERIERYSNDDMWASLASGSARWDAMLVVPASMGSVARIASGVSRTLIERTADVMLKERRKVVMVVREAPYSLIHLRNMTSVTEAGAIILPASPSLYFKPTTIEELCLTVSQRAVEQLGIRVEHQEWGSSR